MKRICIAGSRHRRDIRPFLAILKSFGEPVQLIHGGQVSIDPRTGEKYGADYLAGEAAKQLGFPEPIVYEANWYPVPGGPCHYGAGPERNERMLEHGKPDELHVVHEDPNLGRGTADCYRRAGKKKIKRVKYIHPLP